jgi:hypothetical protein
VSARASLVSRPTPDPNPKFPRPLVSRRVTSLLPTHTNSKHPFLLLPSPRSSTQCLPPTLSATFTSSGIGLEDSLDFTAKLEALDHYSRVLVNPFQPFPSNQLEVARRVDAADIAWIDQDREAPQSDSMEDLDLESPAWSDYYHHLCTAVNAWSVADSVGPMREIIALYHGVLPPARPSSSATPSQAIGPFRIGYNTVQEWSRDSESSADCTRRRLRSAISCCWMPISRPSNSRTAHFGRRRLLFCRQKNLSPPPTLASRRDTEQCAIAYSSDTKHNVSLTSDHVHLHRPSAFTPSHNS